jgi:acetyl esterase/lipase
MGENALWLLLGFVLGYNFSMLYVLLALALLLLLVLLAFSAVARPLVSSAIEAPLVALKLQLNIASTLFAYAKRGFKPLYPRWTLSYEITVFLMRFMFINYGEAIAYENFAMMRPPFAMVGKLMMKSNCREHHTRPEKISVNGMEHLWLRDDARSSDKQRLVVIHYHGGGYTISDPLGVLELANLTHTLLQDALRETHGREDVSVDVLLANYRKSPEVKFPTPLNDCAAMYEHVLATEGLAANRIILSGDSAGAEMSLSTCMNLRDAGRSAELPLACLLYSPDTDMNERDVDASTPHCILTDNFADRVLDQYLSPLQDDKEALLRASPINRELTGLPPLFIQVGSLERFYQQGLRYAERAEKQGVTNVEVDVLEGLPHDVVMFPTAIIPFAKEATRHGAVFAAKHAARVLESEPEPEIEG